jgi:hypothetical protein
VAALAAVLEIPLEDLARLCVPDLDLQKTG